MALSGFWLGEKVLITSVRWLERLKQSKFEEQIMKGLQDPTGSQVRISDLDFSSNICAPAFLNSWPFHRYRRTANKDNHAYLLKFNADSDVAIFRRKEAEGHDIYGLTLDQLGLALSDRSTFPVWTIAYSSYDSPLGSVLAKLCRRRKQNAEKQGIRSSCRRSQEPSLSIWLMAISKVC